MLGRSVLISAMRRPRIRGGLIAAGGHRITEVAVAGEIRRAPRASFASVSRRPVGARVDLDDLDLVVLADFALTPSNLPSRAAVQTFL